MISPRAFLLLAYAATAIPILSGVHQQWIHGDQGLTFHQVFRTLQASWPFLPTSWPAVNFISVDASQEHHPQDKLKVSNQAQQSPQSKTATCGMRMTATQAPPTPTTCIDNDCRGGAAAFMRLPLHTPAEPTPAPVLPRTNKAMPAARPRLAMPRQTDL
ncbi:hypothetical protein BCR37DRAFT_393229 [Protomyces lactucae-debilis]|uniref:Secreted protein n=1 Tax=Protomyces lactucae-debilis TaxID=2754530 RepID=A0A1Y2FBR6_PROLT|nr:uncharacterized protein BCR37DRAFT_393229 [Protomyces lactucae-debilis]ORY81353.1 hypothetical protein BCR37DRAFT_393229 [Protomyces lactucae-debilis]